MDIKYLKAIGRGSYSSPATYGRSVRNGTVIAVREADASVLLEETFEDSETGNVASPLFQLVERPADGRFLDLTNLYRDYSRAQKVTISPEKVPSVKLAKGTELRDANGVLYGYANGDGTYSAIASVEVSAVQQADALTNFASASQITITDRLSNDQESAAFLRQTTFGPTYAEISAATALGSRKMWMVDQLNRRFIERFMDRAYTDLGQNTSFVDQNKSNELDKAIITTLLYDPAALRGKCLWALSKLFVTSAFAGAYDSPGEIFGILAWYDRLNTHTFGNWRDLIESITYSPMMSRMLTYYANEKESADGRRQPDENYAREILQLFTIGLWELNQDGTYKLDGQGNRIPTYTNADIRQIARCLTGLTRWDFNLTTERYDVSNASGDNRARSTFITSSHHGLFGNPDMRLRHYLPFYEYGAKSALGGRLVVPEGTDPVTNLKMLHDALFNHPNVAPFFATRMIQHLVTSNPSPAYVSRVAAAFSDNGFGVRGDLKAVWTAIFCDPEAASDGRVSPNFGRVRDGFDLFANYMRPLARKATDAHGSINDVGDVYSYISYFGMTAPRGAPSIFSAYDPLHSPVEFVDGKLAPEISMWNESLLVNNGNGLLAFILRNEPRDTNSITGQIADYAANLPVTGSAAELVERLNLLFCGGRMSPGLRSSLIATIGTMPVSTTAEQQDRVTNALQIIHVSSDFFVQL